MYCPKCAQPNGDDARFCRACGENLTAVAQAIRKHLPVTLASKLDEHIARKDNRMRRDGVLTGLSGLFLLLSGVWSAASNPAAWLPAVLMFVGALILLLASGWDMLAFKRSRLRGAKDSRLSPAVKTGELEASSPRQIPPASVTEQTTRHLDPAASRSGELS
jgi:hypothetical protein